MNACTNLYSNTLDAYVCRFRTERPLFLSILNESGRILGPSDLSGSLQKIFKYLMLSTKGASINSFQSFMLDY